MTSCPVLFLPGTLCDERVWMPVWRLLNPPQRRYVPLQWAATLDDMLMMTGDRVLPDEKVHLTGFSMGGYVASLWACANPSRVASLTLIGYSTTGLSSDELKRRNQLVIQLGKGTFNPRSPAMMHRLVHPQHRNNSQVAGVVAQMGEDLGAATLLAHTRATTPRKNMLVELGKTDFAVHMIGASDDEVANARDITLQGNRLKRGSVDIIADAGHMMLLEQPQQVCAILQGNYA